MDHLGTWLGLLLRYCDRNNPVVLAFETWLNSYMKKSNTPQSALPILLPCSCTLCIRTANPFERLILISESIQNVINHSPTQDTSPVIITQGRIEWIDFSTETATVAVTVLMNALSLVLDPLSHILVTSKLYIVKNAAEQDRLSQLLPAYYEQWRRKAIKISGSLIQVASVLSPLVECQLEVTAAESVLEVLKSFYGLVDLSVKQLAIADADCPIQSLSQLVERVSYHLTPNIYSMIHGLQKAEKKDSHMKKQAKLIPDLIYSIEQFEATLVQISKKTKGNVNLTMYVRRSTARDFRIDTNVLSRKIEAKENDEIESDTKRRKVDETVNSM